MPRIAIVCGAGIVSGKEIMALELAKGLRAKGCAVDLVTSFWGNGEFKRRAETAGFPTHIMRLGFISATLSFESMRMTAHQMVFWPSLLMSYRRFLRNAKPDKIVHTNWHHALLLWPFLEKARDIYWSHEIIPNKPQYERLFRKLVRRVGRLVAVSEAAESSLLQLGIPKDEIRLIYNGISPQPGATAGGHYSDDIVKIGIVGQVNESKGHEDLLQAFQAVIQTYPNVQLHVFGGAAPDYEARLRRIAAKLGVEASVVWRGYVNDRTAIYKGLSIVVVPSRSEDPLPTSAIEAGLFGIPVVASRRGGLPEIVRDRVTGLLFESGNQAQLASALIMLIGDGDLREKMGKDAHSWTTERFNKDRFMEDFFRLLKPA